MTNVILHSDLLSCVRTLVEHTLIEGNVDTLPSHVFYSVQRVASFIAELDEAAAREEDAQDLQLPLLADEEELEP
jgi:hypothetical protein